MYSRPFCVPYTNCYYNAIPYKYGFGCGWGCPLNKQAKLGAHSLFPYYINNIENLCF